MVYDKANFMFLIVRNQFRMLVKIRVQVQILTILYQLSEYLGIVYIFHSLNFFRKCYLSY